MTGRDPKAAPEQSAGSRMDGAELQMIREYLGLTIDNLAGILQVNPRTVRAWEAGRDLIPERIRGEVERIERYTASAVGELTAELHDARDPYVQIYRSDDAMHAARPDLAHLSARWWRMVAARAIAQVPGRVDIGTVPLRFVDDVSLVPVGEYQPPALDPLLDTLRLRDAPRSDQEAAIRDWLTAHTVTQLMAYTLDEGGFGHLLSPEQRALIATSAD